MAMPLCLQDWITISGATSAVTIQNEADYAEIPQFSDATCYLEVASLTNTGTTSIDVQTSPTKDEVFFNTSLVGGTANSYVFHFPMTSATSTGVQTLQVVRWATGTNQLLSRFLRWRITWPSGGPTTLTFRIWLSLNQAGWA